MQSSSSFFQLLKTNFKSGLTVSLVGIPLSISLAIVSGVSPIVGIITAIWAGLIAALFGGSNYNIIGPTGALSGLIASYAITFGPEMVNMLAITAGIFIIGAYFLHFERYLVFIPSSVIHGFTLGVACIIALNQLNPIFGLHGLPKHDKLMMNVYESLMHLNQFSAHTLLLFIIFFIALLVLRTLVPKIPSAIIIAPLGIATGYLVHLKLLPLHIDTLGSAFGVFDAKLFQMPYLTMNKIPIVPGLVVGLVAILETMLSAKIADAVTKTKHNSRKEMLGLGLANIGSGLLGGMPATAALARTAFNIRVGATSKISAALSSICIALGSMLFLSAFQFIPMAVIAAILVNVALNMIERKHFARFFAHDKTSFGIALLVAAITVFEDPIIGILIGTAVALLLFVEKLSQGHYELMHEKVLFDKDQTSDRDSVLIYSIKGKLVYLNSQAHIARFENDLAKYEWVILRLREVYFVDVDGIDALDEIIELLERRGQKILIARVPDYIAVLLRKMSSKFNELEQKELVFKTTADALDYARSKK